MFLMYIEAKADGSDGEAEASQCKSSSGAQADPDVEGADQEDQCDADHCLDPIQGGGEYVKGPLFLVSKGDPSDEVTITGASDKLKQEGDKEGSGYRSCESPVRRCIPSVEEDPVLVPAVEEQLVSTCLPAA